MNLTIRPLTKEDVQISLEPQPEDRGPRDHFLSEESRSGKTEEDVALDAAMVEELERRLARDDQWAFFCAKVTVSWEGISVSNYLGACSYESGKDFCENSGYFEDMVEEGIEELNGKLRDRLDQLRPRIVEAVDEPGPAVPGVGG